MHIFPEYKYNLKFNISPIQFINIMKENTNIIDQRTNIVREKSKLFTGTFNDMYFECKYENEGMNSGNPKIKGNVTKVEEGCTVELNFSLFPEVKVVIILMYLFLFIFLIATLVIFLVELFHNKLNLIFLIPIVNLLIINVFIRVLMGNQITHSIEDINEIINMQVGVDS